MTVTSHPLSDPSSDIDFGILLDNIDVEHLNGKYISFPNLHRER